MHTKAHTQAVHTDFSPHRRPPTCVRVSNPRQLRLAGRQVGNQSQMRARVRGYLCIRVRSICAYSDTRYHMAAVISLDCHKFRQAKRKPCYSHQTFPPPPPAPLPNAHAHAEKYGWLARLTPWMRVSVLLTASQPLYRIP